MTSKYGDSSSHYNGLGKYTINMIVNLAFWFNKYSQVSDGVTFMQLYSKPRKLISLEKEMSLILLSFIKLATHQPHNISH
jgi:hypothetical protein